MADRTRRERIELLFESALEQVPAHRDGWLQVACVLHRLGLVAMRRGEPEVAERYFREALELARPPTGPPVRRSRPSRARRAPPRAGPSRLGGATPDRGAPHPPREARAARGGRRDLAELGALGAARGDTASARRLFREAYEMQREVLVPGAPALRAVTRQLAAFGDSVGHP